MGMVKVSIMVGLNERGLTFYVVEEECWDWLTYTGKWPGKVLGNRLARVRLFWTKEEVLV